MAQFMLISLALQWISILASSPSNTKILFTNVSIKAVRYAKAKTTEVVALFEKFFPNLENHETQMRKYSREFDRLKEENAELAEKAKAGTQTSINRQLAFAKLQSENAEMHRLIDSIPEDLLQQARQNQKTKSTER